MAFAVSEGKVLAVHKPTYSAPSSIRITDDLSEDYATIYRKQPEVRTVVDFLARNVGQLSLHTFRRIDDNDRERLRDHPVAQLLAEPNPYTTSYRLIHALVSDRGIYDRALWVKTMKDGRRMLVRIPPRLWTIADDDNWLAPSEFIIKGSRGTAKVPAAHAVYFRGYNPEDERYGLSPIESLRRVLSEEHAAGQMREQTLRNGARHSGYISRPKDAPKWEEPARARFKTGWRQQYGGWSASEAGGTPVLEDGMTFIPASQSAVDLQYVESRKLTREEVAAAYFIPPPMIGILDNASFSNITEQHKMLYQDTLGPMLMEIKQEIELQILPDYDDREGVYVEFNMQEKLRGSFEEQAAQLQTSVGAPFLTRNEARARANLPRVEGGDDLVLPLNVLIGGQTSPRDGQTEGGGGTVEALTAGDTLSADDVMARVNAATALIRAGFDPSESLVAVGLDPIKHLGLLPVTIQKPVEPEGVVDESLVDEISKGRRVSVKAKPDTTHVEKARQVLSSFFKRQGQVVRSAAGAGKDWWDEDRWDGELAADLFAVSTLVSTAVALKQLDRLGFGADEYDEARTLEYLKTVASSNAKSINAATRIQVEEAMKAEAPLDAVAHVFEVAESSRAEHAAGTMTTALAGFATVEAVTQVDGTRSAKKTWIVTSSNPRPAHASMNGETVGLDDTFSNGARWPGDSSALDVDDLAGCSCDVQIEIG